MKTLPWTARGLAGLFLCAAGLLPAAAAEIDDVRAALAAPDSDVAASAAADFTTLRGGWRATGLEVAEGDALTVFGHGQAALPNGQTQTPRQLVWLRFGEDGPLIKPALSEDTFPAPAGGEVQLALKPTGAYWADRSGVPEGGFEALPEAEVDLGVTIAVWRNDPAEGLAALSQSPDDAFGRAAAALAAEPALPEGFDHLWFTGRSRVFTAWSDGARTGVRGLPNESGGIIKAPVDIPLTEETAFSFAWIYDSVPALGPETEAANHDYISIALEFDNGQDLTWMASEHLDAGTHFHCPLPWWDARETHMILESGGGDWRAHTRNVAADYAAAIGGPMPGRIVGVWFINVGAFGGHDGDARFANVAISSAGETTQIFAD